MKDGKCPQCSEALTTLQSSGRKVCRSCGWVSKLNQPNSQDNSAKNTKDSLNILLIQDKKEQPRTVKTSSFKYCPECGDPLSINQLEDEKSECQSCGWIDKSQSSNEVLLRQEVKNVNSTIRNIFIIIIIFIAANNSMRSCQSDYSPSPASVELQKLIDKKENELNQNKIYDSK
jgi:ribosomal protein S27AE